MKKPAFAIAALIAATLACSTAKAADITLSWIAPGVLELKAQITTPNGCYFANGAKLGPPEDIPDIENAFVLTLNVDARGEICPQEITVLEYHLKLSRIPKDSVALVIYETWPQAKTIKATAYALPPRKK